MLNVLDMSVSCPAPVAFDGLRAVVTALDDLGTGIRSRLCARSPVEACVLVPAWDEGDPRAIADIALSLSERRLHRESEQVFRVIEAACRAVADTLVEEDVRLRLGRIGSWDTPSLRALARLVEHLTWRGARDRLTLSGVERRGPLGEALAGAGLPSPEPGQLAARLGHLVTADTGPTARHQRVEPVTTPESRLFAAVLDEGGNAVDRIAFAVESVRRGFFRGDYEVMVRCALVGLDLCGPGTHLDGAVIDAVLRRGQMRSLLADAVEFELGLLRGAADVRAFFRKVLGMVHSFRGDNRRALHEFSHIVDGAQYSVELRAQAALYAALTKVKMLRDPAAGARQATQGMALLEQYPTGSDQARRERGWLHNVRALCAFSQGRLGEALTDEKAALACVADGSDSSSVHLKINLISNISVLQERAGKVDSAITTWQKYTVVGVAWGPMFTKHHAYRLGGLALAAGRPEEGATALEAAYAAGDSLSDTFHRAAIATELGGLFLPDDPARAAHWYHTAAEAARDLADPYGHALACAGRDLAGDLAPEPRLAAMAASSVTYPERGTELAAAITSGDRIRCAGLLPRPRTKLNRPFDHVNLS